jgi:phosphatidylglycerophosphate synthase
MVGNYYRQLSTSTTGVDWDIDATHSPVDARAANGLARPIVTAATEPRMSPEDPDRLFSLANMLSLARIPLAAAFWAALHSQHGLPWAPLAILGLAGVTDMLDGYFARCARRDQPRPIVYGRGAWLDPACDKIFVGAVLAALFLERSPPPGLLAMIFARELIQIPLSLAYALIPALRNWLHYDFTASIFGKATTVLQYAAITALLFNAASSYFAVGAFVAGLLALGDYSRRATLAQDHSSDNPPLP